jgi:uncharacterized protein
MKNNFSEIIKKTVEHVRDYFSEDTTGHDFWHINRVWSISKKIARQEKSDMFVVEMSALLHDMSDFKFTNKRAGDRKIISWLKKNKVCEEKINEIINTIDSVSFKGASAENKATTIESKIVQDADRLDALGAIGIARAFAYGGETKRPIYDSEIEPTKYKTFKEYKLNKTTSINHFYEKILLIKRLLNTKTAKQIAENRHKYTKEFLKEFYAEWNGKK